MSVSLDLRKAHKHQRHGDIIAVLTWVNDERALVLLPALRKQAGWYIVQDSAAYRWGVDHPSPDIRRPAQQHALVQSHIACSMLGIEATRANRAKIISIITGWLPDLVSMPSAPEATYLNGSFGEISLSVDGKRIAAQDVKIEDKGASYG
jgi:hypothetical protein